MYQVLYRKYRSQRFADIIGQPQVTVTLKNEMINGRIAHAYLFAGSRGTGKTSCARILAKAVNCLDLQQGDPCGKCDMCLAMDDGTVFDTMEIDAASNNGVDSIRTLIEESAFMPAVAKHRVYIIDEVHMLSTSAFNALLKTLEEPPEHVVFILATTEVHKLLPTILSRCQRFDFKMISASDIAIHLKNVAKQEGVELDEDAAFLIARLADGAMRDALSILDQCLGTGQRVTEETVIQVAGVVSTEYLYTFGRAIVEKSPDLALETIADLYSQSKDMVRLCAETSEYFRNLMLIKTMKKPEQIVVVNERDRQSMVDQALAMNLSDIIAALSELEDTMQRMRFSNQRIALEMAFVRLCAPALDDSSQAILRRVETLERSIKGLLRSKVLEQTDEPGVSNDRSFKGDSQIDLQKQKGTEDAIEELSVAALPFSDWPEIIQSIKEISATIWAAFSGSSAYTSGEYLLIDAPQLALDYLKKPELRKKMKAIISDITGRAYKLGPYRPPKDIDDGADFISELAQRARDAGIVIEEQ